LKILIRTDGSEKLGNGHIFRMKALSDQFQLMNLDHAFAIREDEFWVSNLRNEGRETHQLIHKPENKVSELSGLISSQNVTHLVYDTRDDLNKEELKEVKLRTGVRLTVNDSPEETRLVADVNLYPPIPQLNEWDWSGFEGSEVLSGWDYVLLRKEFVAEQEHKMTHSKPKSVLLAFGSTDPFGLTEKVLTLLGENSEILAGMKFFVVAGPQFARAAPVQELISKLNLTAELIISPQDIADLYRKMDMAIIAFGVTAYELVACQVPFLSVSISADHERSASLFEFSGLSVSIGLINNLEKDFKLKLAAFIASYSTKTSQLNTFNTTFQISNYNKIIHAITN
jgi:spore coat polysaccharide biosynthesis predicted glycosyltransferase SpsG